MKKTIIAALSLVFITVTSVAQPAYSDLINALNYSQNGPAHAAFDGSGQYYNYYWGHTSSGYISGSSVSRATPRRRTATNMSNVGLKIGSSGYNRGAELARYYAEMRAERARLAAERRQRMVDSYMQTQYEKSQNMEATWQMYIVNNSQAKPFSQEAVADFISNGLPGNVIIDDNGIRNMLPEVLLEGAGSLEETKETFEERLKNMSDEEIDQLAEELYKKLDNGEELSDEEWDLLIAIEDERAARLDQLEEKLRQSIEGQIQQKTQKLFDQLNYL